MAEIQLSGEEIAFEDLDLEELVLLKIIFYREKSMLDAFKNRYQEYNEVCASLQDADYIKILGSEMDELIVRPKCESLFKRETSECKEVILYLNTKLGKARGFSPNSAANRRIIQARLKEYSVDELRSVIDCMVQKWKGTNMEFYLRPETLFNETKFQGYYAMSEDSSEEKMSITEML
jgi:uncharacterized phage protein (TIGR02220 family)